MNISELINVLSSITRLLDDLEKTADFVGKDDVTNYLRWTAKNIARTIWEMELAGKGWVNNG